MYLSQPDFLRHIAGECSYVLRVTKSKSREDIFVDETLSKALVRRLEIIGEATKRLDPEFTAHYPHIE